MYNEVNYVRLGSSYIFKKKLLYGEDDIYYFMVGGKAVTDSSCTLCEVSKGILRKDGSKNYPPCCMMDRNEICVEVDGSKTYNRYVNLITPNLSLFLVSYDRAIRLRDK